MVEYRKVYRWGEKIAGIGCCIGLDASWIVFRSAMTMWDIQQNSLKGAICDFRSRGHSFAPHVHQNKPVLVPGVLTPTDVMGPLVDSIFLTRNET